MTKPTITDEDRAAAEAWLDETGGCGCGICLKQSAEFLAHHRQAAFNAGLERAAVIAENHMVDCLDDKDIQKRWPTIRALNGVYATVIRAEKEKLQ